MALLFNGTNQRLKNTTTPVTAVPLTLTAWAFPDDTAGTQQAIIVTSGGRDNHFALALDSSELVRAHTRQTTTSGIAVSSVSATVGAWNHIAAVFTSVTSRAAFLNGGNKGTNTTSATPSSPSRIDIGARAGDETNIFEFWSGRLADVCVFNVALSDDEILSLARGVPPWRIRPGTLVGYWPLLGVDSPEVDLSGGGRAMTLVNAPTRADHAPLTLRRWAA